MAENLQPTAMPQMAGGEADPLAQLRDLHLPGPIDNWPLAPGWWILAGLVIALIFFLIRMVYKRWRKQQYRREGIKALNQIRQAYSENADKNQFLQDYSQLLKRVAYGFSSREQVANLTGEAWVAFLDASGNTKEFSMGSGQILIDGNYTSYHNEFDCNELHTIATQWIKNHTLPEATHA